MRIRLPGKDWRPRDYQLPLWRYLQGGGKRAAVVWNRRSGKDSVAINWSAVDAHQRIGTYWHMLPEAKQGRKVVWEKINSDGTKLIDQAFPLALRAATNETEMKIELKSGSIWQIVGSDNYNSLVGANPIGVVFSEYAVAKPAAWDYIRPILAENGGWAIFPYTPRGNNHGKRLFDLAKSNPGWFTELLTVDDTRSIPLDAINEDRKSGMTEEMVQQEYWCSFEGVQEGAYYAKELALARKESRITRVPHQVGEPVNTYWDLGHNDTTALWFHQRVGLQDRFLLTYEASGEGLAHYVGYLQRQSMERGYVYGRHYLPHDAEHKTLASVSNKDGRCVRELLESAGLRDLVVVQKIDDIMTGIELTRRVFSACYFDAEGCAGGLEALGSYSKEYDEMTRTFRNHPKHDWTSNYADSFRQFAQGYKRAAGNAARGIVMRGWRG